MINYPTVYGHCNAGCKRQVVPYDQWAESVSHVRQRKSGVLYELLMGKEYKIFAPKDDKNQFTCTMKYLYSVKGATEAMEHIIEFVNDDKYAEYFIFRLLDEQKEENTITIIYELAGVRYADTITADGEISITSLRVGLYGATDVLLYNANAQAVLTTDIEVDLSNYYTKSEIIALLEAIKTGATPTVSTEVEMASLLETAEVGSVYKYTGESGTYENGAYYVVEEEETSGYTVSVTSTNKDVYVYEEVPTGDNYETIALGTVSSGNTADFTITTGKLYIRETSGSNLTSHSETGGLEYVSFTNTEGFIVTEFNVTDNGTVSVTYGTYD